MIRTQLGRHSTAGQEYLTSAWSKHVRDARGDNDDFKGVNYATFFVANPATQAHFNVTEHSGRYHSEKHCWLTLCEKVPAFKGLKVASWPEGNFGGALTPQQLLQTTGFRIDGVYTERDACEGCGPLLEEVLPADAHVVWSFVYPSKDTKKNEQPPEQVAAFGMVNLSTRLTDGTTYDETVQEYVRAARMIGNKGLKQALNDL
jgi:hypothetical protein